MVLLFPLSAFVSNFHGLLACVFSLDFYFGFSILLGGVFTLCLRAGTFRFAVAFGIFGISEVLSRKFFSSLGKLSLPVPVFFSLNLSM